MFIYVSADAKYMFQPMYRKPAGAKKFIVRSPGVNSSSIFAHEYPHEDLSDMSGAMKQSNIINFFLKKTVC